jgi:hypothetical protein
MIKPLYKYNKKTTQLIAEINLFKNLFIMFNPIKSNLQIKKKEIRYLLFKIRKNLIIPMIPGCKLTLQD